jgi:hypothetical protein
MKAPRLDISPWVFAPFCVKDEWIDRDPMMAQLADLYAPGAKMYARVDIAAPLGCEFSLFVVAGFPNSADDEFSCAVMTVVADQRLVLMLTDNLQPGYTVTEIKNPLAIKDIA